MNNAELKKEVKRLVHNNRHKKGYVCAVDILIQLNYLSKEDYEAWRFGRVDYLEKVCKINLNKLTLINKSIRKYSTELALKSSWTAYNKYGKGAKQRLRFSKTGKKSIEDAYATHYVDRKRIKELKENKDNSN
jgi:ribosomal protein L35